MELRDRGQIEKLYSESEFCCDWEPLDSGQMEAVEVLVDDDDRILMVCAAQKVVNVYLLTGKMDPRAKETGIEMLHRKMRLELKLHGIRNGIAWLQPKVLKAFGRRLTRDFGWTMRNGPVFITRIEHE